MSYRAMSEENWVNSDEWWVMSNDFLKTKQPLNLQAFCLVSQKEKEKEKTQIVIFSFQPS